MAGPGNILIRVGAEAGQAVSELSKVNRGLGDTMTTTEKMHAGLKKAALPAAAALGAIGVAAMGAAKAAAEDEASQASLAGALERTTGASKKQIAAAEEYISKLELQTGVADDELRPALAKLSSATGSVAEGQSQLALALDISAQSHKSLAVVSKSLAAADDGRTASLAKLVPGLDEATLKSKDMTKITKELADATGGAATEAAQTATGQYKVMQVQMAELQEDLGTALIPIISQLSKVLLEATQFAREHTTVIKVLVGIVASLSAAILIANGAIKAYEAYQTLAKVATKAWAAAQWLLNAALEANPIGLVIAAVAALAAGIYLAYTRSETFRNIVGDALDVVAAGARALERAFDAARGAAIEAFSWVTNHWKLALFAFGPIGAAVYAISENFDRIKSAAKAAFDAITAGVDAVVDAIKPLVDWLSKIHFPKPPGWLHIPGTRGLAVFPAPTARTSAGVAAAGSSGGAGGITINVFGATDPEGTARAIRRTLRGFERRQGVLASIPAR